VDAQRGAEYTGDTLVSSAASETRTADGAAEGARCDDGPGDGVEVSKSGKGTVYYILLCYARTCDRRANQATQVGREKSVRFGVVHERRRTEDNAKTV
jgi:hypothetical protein